jgi:hypothetical protein
MTTAPPGGITQRLASDLRADPQLGPLADRASSFLGRLAETTFLPTTAEWSVVTDGDRRRVRVELRDEKGWLRADYRPEELASEANMRYELIQLWGDMLEVRSRGLPVRLMEEFFSRLGASHDG